MPSLWIEAQKSHKCAIVWFRNDLRLLDHELSRPRKKLIPVYVVDPDRWREDEPGFVKIGHFQTQFLLESLADLKRSLQSIGSDLVILQGGSAAKLQKLAANHGATAVFASKEAAWEVAPTLS